MTTLPTKLTGTRFGEIEFSAEDVVTFPDGLIGFPTMNQFIILCPNPETPFRWLQSVEEPGLAFLVTFPLEHIPDYEPEFPEGTAADLKIFEGTAWMVLVTANIPKGAPRDMTVNLAGPLVINADLRIGRQVVLENEAYTIRHRVFPSAEGIGSGQAA